MKTLVYLLPFFAALAFTSCFRVEGDFLIDDETEVLAEGVTVYTANDQQLIARSADLEDNLGWMYGSFSATGQPETVRAAIFQPSGEDRRYHFLLDEENRLRYLYFENTDGTRLPALLKFTYASDGSSNRVLLFSTDWLGSTVLSWEVELLQDTSGVVPVPVFVRDECEMVLGLAMNLQPVIQVLEEVLPAAFLPTPSWLREEVLPDIERAVRFFAEACTAGLHISTGQPLERETPESPMLLGSLLDPATNVQPCTSASEVDFSVDRETDGRVYFFGISGGRRPYSYSFDGSNFQADSIFTGQYTSGSAYLMAVRDASGCVSARIAPIYSPKPGAVGRVIMRSKQPGASFFEINGIFDFNYNESGQVIAINSALLIGEIKEIRLQYQYRNGKLLRYQRSEKTSTSTQEETFSMSYNSQGRIGSLSYRRDALPAENIDLAYDASGRLIRWQRSEGNYALFSYDSAGNLIQLDEFSNTSGGQQIGNRFSYWYQNQTDLFEVFNGYFPMFYQNIGKDYLMAYLANGQQFTNRLGRVAYTEGPGGYVSDYQYKFGPTGRLTEIFFRNQDGKETSFLLEYQ